ncbi:uncharacterized protein DUF2752 [Dysgonomonas alginatilytica]|uniref:Uncharacterized protein DUF2752 n=1 Tax=Dysgonomonas alginatilytica TaxID=1605892 RepID=A0A2V3PMQ9_9BACT|nr:DUF2752 domain-containing protein [Dysgonomonas alginatilytica]PXV63313.1 uncharacterized protein DUF2752 [Dysgonomonas alginatilytica]
MRITSPIKQLPQSFKYTLVIALAYASLLLMDLYQNHEHNSTICVFKNLTGIPCPGCGLGRATLALFNGNFIQSFHYHILGMPLTIFIVISLICLLTDTIRGKEVFISKINSLITWKVYLLFLILTLFSWYINIQRGI